MGLVRWDRMDLFSGTDAPTNASYTSAVIDTSGFPSGWIEINVPHTGDAVGVLSLQGGASRTQSTHDDLSLDFTQVFINGVNLSGTAFTGITATGSAQPGSLSIAAAQVADARIRIPAINLPQFISLDWVRSSGGSASQYLTAVWYGNAGT